MMRTSLYGSIFLLFIAVTLCSAQGNYQNNTQGTLQGKFGVGFVVGEPTGIAWKYRIDQTNAVDGAIGFSPFNEYRLHVDYLWQAYPFHEQNLGMHYGAGVAFGSGRSGYTNSGYFNQEIGFAFRGVVGMDYTIRRTPLDLFFELAPLIVLTPNSASGLDAGFGARVYF